MLTSLLFTGFESMQRSLCKQAGYKVRKTGSGLWARHESLEDDPRHKYLFQTSETESLTKWGASEADLEMMASGWQGLSETNNPGLAEALAGVRWALRADGPLAISVGLTVYPVFNAEASVGHNFILLHLPLMYGLDMLATFGIALAHLRAQLQTIREHLDPDVEARRVADNFSRNISRIESAVSNTLDFVARVAPWESRKMMEVVEVWNQSQGPDLRFGRLGYEIALTQRMWILLHEYAHVLRHHLPAVGSRAFEQEFDADAFATEKMDDVPREMNQVDSETAVPLLFDIFEAAELRIRRQSATHPSSSERRERVQAATPQWLTWGSGAEDSVFKNL